MGRGFVNPDKFDIKYTRTPQTRHGLSSTVIVDNDFYVNVSFSVSLIRRAGLKLKEGVSAFRPAYLSVEFDVENNRYLMFVQYLDSNRSTGRHRILVFKERPKWLTYMRPLPGKVKPKEQKENHANTTDRTAQPA